MTKQHQIPILNIKQFEQKITTSDFYSNSFEKHSEKNKNIIFKPHSHNFFLCVLFTSASGVHEIDFNTYPIESGSVFFLKPGQTHFWKFTSPPKGYIFFHTQDFYELCFLKSTLSQFPFYFTNENPPALTLINKNIDKIKYLFQEIHTEYLSDSIYKYEKLNSLINLLYIDLTRYYTKLNPNKIAISKTYLNILQDFKTSLDAYFKEEKSASFYASKLNITTKHLNRVTNATLNKTSSAVIKERIILEAKRILVHTNTPLTEVASTLGFPEYSYFSRLFKSSVGITPYNFRKKY